MKKAYIKAISYYLPEKILSNEDLVKEFPEWSVEKVALKIGILERHIADKTECASDLAFQAAKKMFKEHSVEILFCCAPKVLIISCQLQRVFFNINWEFQLLQGHWISIWGVQVLYMDYPWPKG